ncbi:hypothetical protein EDB81DRAFT_801919 [Dactylonectria macrodidyma]|uniref:Uncharacterized protein n=1 Tax=Dactylonectria macrodidyma TaxID=307937 RepID=A0A9P9EFR9_9HYPO|nr:hypothetical protein EDB81DRAFT_801919 [Dactylonectria macrodidyma]
MLPTWIYHFSRLSFTLLSSICPTHSSTLSTNNAFPTMDEQRVERIFDDAFGAHLRDTPKDELDVWSQGMALIERVKQGLETVAESGDKGLFGQAFEDFAWERVPLSTTRDALFHVFEILDNHELRAEFDDFLNAPLDTEEQQATARAALCRITGLPTTVKERPNAEQLRAQVLAIIEDVQVRWKDQPEKLDLFLTKFLSLGLKEDQAAAISELTVAAASEPDLVESLEKMHSIIKQEHDEL